MQKKREIESDRCMTRTETDDLWFVYITSFINNLKVLFKSALTGRDWPDSTSPTHYASSGYSVLPIQIQIFNMVFCLMVKCGFKENDVKNVVKIVAVLRVFLVTPYKTAPVFTRPFIHVMRCYCSSWRRFWCSVWTSLGARVASWRPSIMHPQPCRLGGFIV